MAPKNLSESQAAPPSRSDEDWYRSVFAVLDEGVLIQDSSGVIRECNESAARILGVPAGVLVGKHVGSSAWATIRPDGSPFPTDEYPTLVTLRTGEPCDNVVLGLIRPGGKVIWLSLNTRLLPRAGEARPHVVTSIVDVTARREAELAARHSEFLSRASQALASSLDYETTLHTVARLA